MTTPEPTLLDLITPPADPPPRILCGRPLPPWTQLLADAGIPDAPGHHETAAPGAHGPVGGCKPGTTVPD